jgi:hypothetical protein
MIKIEFSNAELVALSKALQFVRFSSEDYDAKEFAGSPHIAEVYKRVCEATNEYYKSLNIRVSEEWPFIETVKGYLNVVKVHIKHTNNWPDLQPSQKDLYVKTLIFPYKVSDKTISELIQYGDEIHFMA